MFYGGIAGASLPMEMFELGQGISLHKTYAHLFSPCVMAFAPAPSGGHHPPPWKTAHGGFAFDITIELRVPNGLEYGGIEGKELALLLIGLMRLSAAPYLTMPVSCDMSFADVVQSPQEPTISPLEIEPGLFAIPDDHDGILRCGDLDWLREKWAAIATLMQQQPKLHTAFQAWDACRLLKRTSASLLTIWGALEQIYAPAAGELRYRVAANMAVYLAPRGPTRLKSYKNFLQLYNKRSIAAHTADESDLESLTESWILLRNTLVKIINDGRMPRQSDFEFFTFADTNGATDGVSWGGGNGTVAD